MPTETLELTVDADVPRDVLSEIDSGRHIWTGGTADNPIELRISRSDEGEGFGLTEVFTVMVIVGGNVASDLIADAIRAGLKGVIRRVRASDDQSDGSASELTELLNRHRREDDDDDDDDDDD